MNSRNGSRFSRLLRFLFIVVLLSMLSLSLFGAAQRVRASSLVVNSLSDTSSGSCASTYTLCDAITLTASGDTITFSVSGTLTLNSSLPAIAKTLIIDGSGQSVAINGNFSHQLMSVSASGVLSLNALTLENGFGSSGGAISNGGGTLNIANSTLATNSASTNGGAISSASGTVNIANSTFSGNIANGGADGAIYNGGTLHVTNSSFSGNVANTFARPRTSGSIGQEAWKRSKGYGGL